MKTDVHTKTCMQMLIAALFKVVKSGNNLNVYQVMSEQTKHVIYNQWNIIHLYKVIKY